MEFADAVLYSRLKLLAKHYKLFMTYLFDILYLHLASNILMLSNVLTEFVSSVLQLSYDLTWQKLKEKFSHCGMSSTSE